MKIYFVLRLECDISMESNNETKTTLYFCNALDPDCPKTVCYMRGGPCCHTSKKSFRKDIFIDGKKIDPILVPFGDNIEFEQLAEPLMFETIFGIKQDNVSI